MVQNIIIEDNIGEKMTQYDNDKLKLIELGMIGNLKRSVNFFPYKVGLISADNSAATRDVLSVFENDKFVGKVYLKNTIMQGENCPKSVMDAIQYFNDRPTLVDIIIIYRGGGSKEDLKDFNNYKMMLRVGKSINMTICAIGHASDTTELINYVADISKETPSLAAKYIIDRQNIYIDKLKKISSYINNFITKHNNLKQLFMNVDQNNLLDIMHKKSVNNKMLMIKNKINDFTLKYQQLSMMFSKQSINYIPKLFKDNKQIMTIDDFSVGNKRMLISFYDGTQVDLYYQLKKMK